MMASRRPRRMRESSCSTSTCPRFTPLTDLHRVKNVVAFGERACNGSEAGRGNGLLEFSLEAFCTMEGCCGEDPQLPQRLADAAPKMFRYTFLRDPVDRFLSAFGEMHKRGRQTNLTWYAGMPWASVGAAPGNCTSEHDCRRKRTQVHERLAALVSALEQPWPEGRPFDEHLTAQTVYLQRPTTKEPHGLLHLDFVGRYGDDISGELEELRSAMSRWRNHFATRTSTVSEERLHNVKHIRARNSSYAASLQPADLDPDLRRRICALYVVDYCCLGLPISPGCEAPVCA
eukprot:TRINITY_DN7331_c0_g1_i7.p1 TRINITY_DN7331_c0_g1~~TRINITY_DN7331_c0_g1_i7.p1  ORF type:complete len:288 (+),score=29.51 TRINITY_DN7331_c0_g1_i7:330-1193(+)